MTEKEKLMEVIEDGMIVEFNNGNLGIYIKRTIIHIHGGTVIERYNHNLELCDNSNYNIRKVFSLQECDYAADIMFWLKSKYFLEHIDKVVWERKPTVSFIDFLKDNNAYDAYMNNIRVENQRWGTLEEYIKPEDIQDLEPDEWISRAFKWNMQSLGSAYWATIHNKWNDVCKTYEVKWE